MTEICSRKLDVIGVLLKYPDGIYERHLVEELGVDEIAARVIVQNLLAHGIVEFGPSPGSALVLTDGGKQWFSNPESAFLSPYHYLYTCFDGPGHLARVMRGEEEAKAPSFCSVSGQMNPMADAEAGKGNVDAMFARGQYEAAGIAAAFETPPKRLLDIAGGSGIHSAAVLQKHTRTKAEILEQAASLEAARKVANEYGVNRRLEVREGDMFTSPLTVRDNQPDAILLSNVIHDWTPEQVRVLAGRCFDALEKGGRLYIHDQLCSIGDRLTCSNTDYQNVVLAGRSVALYYFTGRRGSVFSEDEVHRIFERGAGFSIEPDLRSQTPAFGKVKVYKKIR